MSVMNVVRIAKVIALLAFVLPWVAVSCNNVDVATASGIELIQGKMSENPHAQEQMRQQMASQFGTAGLGGLESGSGDDFGMGQSKPMPDLGMNYFGIAAAAVIAIGLVLSLIGKGASTARNVLVTSLLGMALVFGTVWWWKDAVKKQGGAEEARDNAAASPFGPPGGSPFGGGMGAAGANMLDPMLQERIGYWLALGALAVAAGAGAVGMRGGASSVKPEGEA